MREQRRAVGVAEVSAVLAAIVLLFATTSAITSRAREMSRRSLCSLNLKAFGTAAMVYADDHDGGWPVPPFDRSLPSFETEETVDYILEAGYWRDGVFHEGMVGWNRRYPSNSISPSASTQVSVTRAFWLLVHAAAVSPKQFVCPSSSDSADSTENLDLYYDFSDYTSISYGYQVPFGPPDTRPRQGMYPQQVVAADKGPFYLETDAYRDWYNAADGWFITLNDARKAWRPYNSANHGGVLNGEGQQVLFADGHATFVQTPCAGIDNNNIYTVIEYEWGSPLQRNLIHGQLPGETDPPPFPGQNALGMDFEDYASTDSLIYP